jgi:urease accessory protein
MTTAMNITTTIERREMGFELSTEFEQDMSYLRLLHLADSALPIGALAHSFGLETLTARALIAPKDLSALLRVHLEEAGSMEAVFCRAGFRIESEFSSARWIDINERLSALKPGRESRTASAALGQRFLTAVVGLGKFPRLEEAITETRRAGSCVHHSVAFGLASAVLALDEDRAVLAYVHQSVASLVSACQRLLPLGQSQATAILWDLKSAIIKSADRSRTCALDDAGCFMPLFDWGTMEHPALATRLFIS